MLAIAFAVFWESQHKEYFLPYNNYKICPLVTKQGKIIDCQIYYAFYLQKNFSQAAAPSAKQTKLYYVNLECLQKGLVVLKSRSDTEENVNINTPLRVWIF